MEQLPIFVTVAGQPVLLVGNGPAATAKERLLQAAGARVVRTAEAAARLAFIAIEMDVEAEAARLKALGLLVNVVDRPDLSDFTVPAIVDRAPVIVAIGTGGASASLARILRERLEALLPARLGVLARAIRAARPAVAAARATMVARRGFWDRLLQAGGPLDPLDDVTDPDAVIAAALEGDDVVGETVSTITLASHDPDELTLRQARLLMQADTLFHDSDVPQAVLDRARRDAARIASTTLPEPLPPGHSVILRSGRPR